jgi:hypothetical protein
MSSSICMHTLQRFGSHICIEIYLFVNWEYFVSVAFIVLFRTDAQLDLKNTQKQSPNSVYKFKKLRSSIKLVAIRSSQSNWITKLFWLKWLHPAVSLREK